MCWLGWSYSSCPIPSGLPALFVAYAEGHLGILYRREDLQWQWAIVPLDLQGLQDWYGSDGPTTVRGWGSDQDRQCGHTEALVRGGYVPRLESFSSGFSMWWSDLLSSSQWQCGRRRLRKIARKIVIKLEKMRRGSKTERVVSSTPGLWTGSMWQMLMKEFVDMWWTKVEMKQGKIAATRGLRPTSRLQCSQTSSAGGGSMRRRLGLKRSRRKKLSRSRSQISLLQQVLPSMSRFRLRRMQLKVLQHLLVHHSRSDRREDPRRPSADDPAQGGTLSDGGQLLVWPEDRVGPSSKISWIVDRRRKGRKRSSALNALPLFTHPKGGPGVGWFFALLGFPVFGIGSWGFMPGFAAPNRSVVRVRFGLGIFLCDLLSLAWSLHGMLMDLFLSSSWIIQGSTLTMHLRSFRDSALLSIKPAVRSWSQIPGTWLYWRTMISFGISVIGRVFLSQDLQDG